MFIKNGSIKKYQRIISYVPPFIVQQPLSATVAENTDHTFYLKAKGSQPLTYQWYRNNFPLSNQTTDTLTLTSISFSDENYYYCKVTNYKYTINSNFVKLNVRSYPVITVQPSSVTTLLGSLTSLSVSVSGSDPISYQWYKDYQTISATTSSFYIFNASPSDEGSYFVVVSNEVGTLTSNSVTVTVL